MEPELYPTNEESQTLRDYLRVPFRQRSVMFMSVITVFLMVVLYVDLKTPLYESQVGMLISAEKQVESPYQQGLRQAQTLHVDITQPEMVKSAPVLERVVTAMGLAQRPPDYEKRYASPLKSDLITVLVGIREMKLARLSEEQRKDYLFRLAVESLRNRIVVQPQRDTYLFMIKVRDYDPTVASRIANAVSRSYVMTDLEQQLADFMSKYGEENPAVRQLKDDIDAMGKNLNGLPLPNVEAIGPASVKIIEQANIPFKPVGPEKGLIVIFGVIMSIVLGLILSFLFEYLDPTYRSSQELDRELNAPCLGFIPKRKTHDKILIKDRHKQRRYISFRRVLAEQMLLSLDDDRREGDEKKSLVVQSVRSVNEMIELKVQSPNSIPLVRYQDGDGEYLRFNKLFADKLYLNAKDQHVKSIMVTSATSEEDLYKVLFNLGFNLSQKNKVLLIDGNFHYPPQYTTLAAGLADIIEGKNILEEVVRDLSENLHLLSAGALEDNPVFTLDSDKTREILRQAKEKYDFVLVACPDLSHFKDANVISRFTDATVVVVSEGQTRRKVLKAALEGLKQRKIKILGTILDNRTFPIPKFFYDWM